jgi:hypothetical protein
MKFQNEIQSMHWHNFHVNIVVHISYQQNPLANPIDPSSSIIKKVHYYVSNDWNRDSLYVQHAFMLHCLA